VVIGRAALPPDHRSLA